ncbi:TonB system transport protein ExbD [Campylobacter sputorum bv. paraureolyticus LMG 11764]|nr:TonB system transport protein ExbD [Campylobacter sputorum bv. paraureolyticus LMG 11764]
MIWKEFLCLFIKDLKMKYVSKFKNKRRRREYYGISMINLIDVIFMLLIFFMITTTFAKTENFPINLPKSSEDFSDNRPQSITLFYFLNGNISINFDNKNTTFLNLDDFKNNIKSLNLANFNEIHLSADNGLDYGNIINLISILKENDVSKINLDIEKIR